MAGAGESELVLSMTNGLSCMRWARRAKTAQFLALRARIVRSQPVLPMMPGMPEPPATTVRHGVTSLFTAFRLLTALSSVNCIAATGPSSSRSSWSR